VIAVRAPSDGVDVTSACYGQCGVSNGSVRSNEPGGVQSVDRAVVLMEFLAERSWSGVTEVARALGVHKSTAFRLLATLERRGMVEQDPDTTKYRLGPGVARLARTVADEIDLRRHARDAIQRLADDTAETVNLSILDGSEVIYVDQVIGSSSVLGVDWLGRRTPLHCTASGKLYLAYLPEPRRRLMFERELERFTPQTIVDHDVLERQLTRIRADGYATTLGELETGLNAVGAPIFSSSVEIVGAVTVSGPDSRMQAARLPVVGEQVKAAADTVSRRLGYEGAA
jgi:DNA-binding IclR family transcriptional regulator